LRPTVSRPVRLGIGLPFRILDQILSCSSFSSDNYFILRSKASSLTRKRVCSLQCNHSLIRPLTPNHTLPSHLRLCSLFVASYDSQGLRWKYSNPPPHGRGHFLGSGPRYIERYGSHRKHRFHYCVFSRCQKNNMPTEMFPSNGFLKITITWQLFYMSQYH
jgi:hypothetical protein